MSFERAASIVEREGSLALDAKEGEPGNGIRIQDASISQ